MSIRLEHVNYIYKDNSDDVHQALKDVNLEIRPGEFIGIVGHTGSGKSTLIQHLNGLLRPSSGKVLYDEKDIFEEGYPLRQLRGKVGVCFQYPEYQLFEQNILEDVCFGPMNFGKTKEEAMTLAKGALASVGMSEDLFLKSPFELSGGQKRRVAIAGILAMEPEYFVLDEPTAGLDPIGRDQILNLLRKLHEKKNMTIILVSHSMEDVAEYVDRMIVMNHGEVLFDDDKRKVFQHEKELNEIGLSVPFYCSLMKDLNAHGFPVKTDVLTVEEAKEAIMEVIRKKRNNA